MPGVIQLPMPRQMPHLRHPGAIQHRGHGTSVRGHQREAIGDEIRHALFGVKDVQAGQQRTRRQRAQTLRASVQMFVRAAAVILLVAR